MKLLRSLTALFLVIALLGFAGCSDDEDDDNPAGPTTTDWYADLQEAAITYANDYSTANISAATVYENFAAGTDMFIIDWRAADAYAAGHIDISSATGTVTLQNWAFSDLYENMAQLPTDVLIVNVCYSGQTASQVTMAMHIAGYDNARNMLFGMCGWTGGDPWASKTDIGWTDLETTSNTWPTETVTVPTVELDASDVAEAALLAWDNYMTEATSPQNITASDVQTLLLDGDDTNDPFIINYWPESEYAAGHLPGAYQLTPKSWSEDVFATLPTDRMIVVYCYTGQTSSQMTGMLRILGYEAKSLSFGMNSINQNHPNNHAFSPVAESYPVTTD